MLHKNTSEINGSTSSLLLKIWMIEIISESSVSLFFNPFTDALSRQSKGLSSTKNRVAVLINTSAKLSAFLRWKKCGFPDFYPQPTGNFHDGNLLLQAPPVPHLKIKDLFFLLISSRYHLPLPLITFGSIYHLLIILCRIMRNVSKLYFIFPTQRCSF